MFPQPPNWELGMFIGLCTHEVQFKRYNFLTPKSGILSTDICIGDFFNRHEFMKHWVEVMFSYYYL